MTEDELKTLGALAEQAGALGAMRTLSELGLADGRAREDMAELRELLEAWRAARGRAWRALAGWLGDGRRSGQAGARSSWTRPLSDLRPASASAGR